MRRYLLCIVLSLAAFSQEKNYEIVKRFPHNVKSFTQGLFYHDGFLYEGTGLKKESKLLKVSIADGKAQYIHKLKDIYFGEGIAAFNNKIIQLTWNSSTAFVYDLKTLKELRSFSYQSEGWGVSFDGSYLIVSDGSNKLSFYNVNSFVKEYDIDVIDWDGNPISFLNELEYVNGELFANVYQENRIVRIDPNSGNLIEEYNLDAIVKEEKKRNPKAKELNGIAYNPSSKSFYITGKLWSSLYEIKFK